MTWPRESRGTAGKAAGFAARLKASLERVPRPTNPQPRLLFLEVFRFFVQRLGTWPAVLFMVTIPLALWQVSIGTNDFLVAGLWFCAAFIMLAVKSLRYVHREAESQLKLPSAMIVMALCCVICISECYWLYCKDAKAGNLHLDGLLTMVGDTSRSGNIWAYYNGLHGGFITQANIFADAAIINKSKDPLFIGTVEAQYRNVWRRWVSFDTLPNGALFYAYGHPGFGRSVSFSAPNVTSIVPESLEPEKAYRAYALFQYPAGFDVKGKQLRMKVCDREDDCSYSYFRYTSSKPRGDLANGVAYTTMTLNSDNTDLSGYRVSRWRDEER